MIAYFKAYAKQLLARRGLRLQRTLKPFLEHPEALLAPTFDHIVSRHALGATNFFFVQIGANDGIAHDPIRRYVTRLNWRGVLIEPQASVFRTLVENYKGQPNLVFKNVAISDKNETKTLYTVRLDRGPLPEWAHELASFNLKTILSHKSLIPNLEDLIIEEPVEAITLDSLFVGLNEPTIDLLQIDVEGYDYEVLKLLNFRETKPKIIHYEHGHLVEADMIACLELLISHGYRIALEERDTTAYLNP